MGLNDRDYMRERSRRNFERVIDVRERPFAPPPDGSPLLLKVLAWVCIAFVTYKAWGLVEAKKAARQVAPSGVQVTEPAPANPSRFDAPRVRPPQPAYAPAPVPQSAASPVVVAPRTGGTIYLCKDYGGGSFWSSNHCNQHNALIDRIVSVPQGMPFEQQVSIAEERRRVLAPERPTQVTVPVPSAPNGNNNAACASLGSRVDALDAMARQPQSGAMQDWIRSERKKIRDEQFRLRC